MDSSRSRSQFRILDLPPELRNRIYEFAFSLPEGIYFLEQHFKLKDGATLPVALLRSCRQIHSEAISILYSINKVTCENVWYLAWDLERIGSSNVGILRTVETHGGPPLRKKDVRQFCVLMRKAKKLGKLRLGYHFHAQLGCEALVKLMGPLFRGLHKAEMKKEAKERRNVTEIVKFLPYTLWYDQRREYDAEMVKGMESEFREAMKKTFK